MRLFLSFFLLFPVVLFAQSKYKVQPTDSIGFYSNLIRDRYKQVLDSLKNSPETKEVMERLNYLSSHSDNYRSVVFYTDVSAADFNHLNSTLVPEGFSALKKTILRFGYGFSSKYNKVVFDFYIGTLGLNNKSKKGNENVKATFNNLFQVDLGYDLTRSQSVNIYPYAGVSIRSMSLEYNKPAQTNESYSDITNIVQNDPTVTTSATGVGYQAGIGFDFVIGNNKNKTSGTMIFVKAGTSGVFGNPAYKIQNIHYNPGIVYGRWNVTAGFKFFGRNPKHSYDSKR
ncbi:MAG: hypothetical protein M3R72_02295 [Bacteroidota bacterium]|nr:hypothetical protein [Bacteroidota bacterium]